MLLDGSVGIVGGTVLLDGSVGIVGGTVLFDGIVGVEGGGQVPKSSQVQVLVV